MTDATRSTAHPFFTGDDRNQNREANRLLRGASSHIITTPAELRDLPAMTIIRGRQNHGAFEKGPAGWWQAGNGINNCLSNGDLIRALPAIVLWMPPEDF